MRIITRYLLTEFVAPFLLGLFCFTFILLLNEIFLLTKTFVQKGLGLRYLVELILYILPATLVLTIPMAVLVGLLLSFGNLSTQNEITAIKASGIGLHQLARPILIMGLIISVLDLGVMNYLLPRANQAHLNLLYDIRARHTAMNLEEGVLMRELEREGKIWIYDRQDPVTGKLEHVRIFDDYQDGQPRLIVAREADVGFKEGYAHLRLYDGYSYDPDARDPRRYTTFRFREKDLALDVTQALQRTDRDWQATHPRNMSLGRLSRYLQEQRALLQRERQIHAKAAIQRNVADPQAYVEARLRYRRNLIARGRVEWHKKIAIPFACLAFGVIGVPLGIAVRRSGRMVGLGIGLGLILVYYVLLQMGQTLGVRGILSPWLAMWFPNLLTFLAGGILLLRFTYGSLTTLIHRT